MKETIVKIVQKYNRDKSFLIPMLQDVQKEFNYLPRPALNAVSEELAIPLSRIYEAATFYKAFSLTPRGKHQLSLCVGTACHVRGSVLIQDHMERVLDIKAGKTTPDLEYTFETVNCVGACALGPILIADDEYHGQVTISKTNKIFKKLGKKVASDEED